MSEPLRTVVSIAIVGDADDRLSAAIAERVAPYGGSWLGTAAGIAVTFETPADAVHFAAAIRAEARELHAHVAAGIDHGAPGTSPNDPGTVSAAIARYARAGEILLTDIVCRLAGPVPGSHYVDRGRVRPPGLDERHQLHELTTAAEEQRAAPVLGRDAELDAIDRALEQIMNGRGRVLFLEGPAGIGKSHLARAAATRARTLGLRVVTGEADELHRDRPGELVAAVAASLGVPNGDLGAKRTALHTAGVDPAFTVIERFVDAVSAAANAGPVLVIAEDAHWADGLSLRALTAVARIVGPLPAGLLVTLRPDPRPDQLARCLETADADHGALLRVGSLDSLASTGLVTARTGAVPGPRLRRLLDDLGGNPLYVTELVRALEDEGNLRVERGVADLTDGDRGPPVDRATTMPTTSQEGLTRTIRRRLAGLPAATNDVLRLASLLGTTFTLEDLATVASRRVVDVASDLMPALSGDLVVGDGDRLAFHHDLVRESIYLAVPDAVRRDLHAAAGRSLAGAGAPASTVADQFGAGARVSDSLAIAWLVRAAEEATIVDTRAAVDRYEQALDLVPHGEQATRDRLEAALVELLGWVGRVDEATELAASLLSRSLSAGDELAARRALASTLAIGGDLLAATEQCRLALEAHPDDAESDVLRCAAAGMSMITGSDATAAIELATDVARSEERSPACWAEQTLGIAALTEGRYHDAHGHFQRSRSLLESGFVPPLGFLIPHSWEGGALFYADRFDEATERMQLTRARGEARGDVGLLVQAHAGIGLGHYITGAWDDARAEIEALLTVGDETGASAHQLLAHAVMAAIALDRGERADADAHLERGHAVLAGGTTHLYGAELLAWVTARVLAADGDPERAHAILEMLWTQMEPIVFLLQCDLVLPMLVSLRKESGDQAGACDLTEILALAAERSEVTSYRAAAHRCRGLVDRDPDVIVEAAALSSTTPRRISHAGMLEDAARALIDAGRTDEARAVIDEAIGVVGTMGAIGWIGRLQGLATAAGLPGQAPPTPRPTHGWESLSPKEHEVVVLVADGLSNPDIAERLFISRRTVESHLSHVFRKLDLANRTQLARASLEREH